MAKPDYYMRFDGINTKVRALSGQLAKQRDYENYCAGVYPPVGIGVRQAYKKLRHYLYDFPCREYMDAAYLYNTGGLESCLRIFKKQSRLTDKKNRSVAARLKGTEMDLINITWVYRLLHYHGQRGAEILTHLIPVTYRLTAESLIHMSESGEALLEEVSKGPYKGVFGNFTRPEHSGNLYLAGLYTRESRLNPGTLAPVMAYLFYKQMEIENKTAITEGLKRQMPPWAMVPYLIP
jgi:hypothetical protein